MQSILYHYCCAVTTAGGLLHDDIPAEHSHFSSCLSLSFSLFRWINPFPFSSFGPPTQHLSIYRISHSGHVSRFTARWCPMIDRPLLLLLLLLLLLILGGRPIWIFTNPQEALGKYFFFFSSSFAGFDIQAEKNKTIFFVFWMRLEKRENAGRTRTQAELRRSLCYFFLRKRAVSN